ncbi:acyl-CoA dehydrogenase family protein [bacterium]|nr:acyl-CoA dehydrogenase family protein [Flavobacteriales bacterium]MDB4678337.1 acyl-CoA dehydrogenase family protein [bacterium]
MTLKGGSFLIEKGNPKDIFINEEFTEEQKMIGEMVRDFCVQEIQEPLKKNGYELEASKHQAEIVALLEKSAELGLCGVAISEEYGGIDLDFNTGLIFSEMIAQGFSFATTIGAHTSIGSLPIVYYGNEAQKAKYLPGVASAKLKASYCLTEPTAGSDANSGKTKCVLNEAGTHYLMNGQKMWITNGGFADIFIVFAKIDDDDKLTAFIVEKEFGGITLGAEEKKLGIKGSSTVQVFFENTPVPIENLLGERQGGFAMALNILNTGRIKLAAGTNGGGKFAITQAIQYAKERKQFDTPIVEFGAMQHKLGEMASRVFCVDAGVWRIGRNIDLKTEEFIAAGKSKQEAKLEAIREYAIECAILKVAGSENIDYAVDETLQIFGGMGYSAETGIEMAYRDARITRIYEGTNEINRMLSVAELTKRALKTKEIDLIGAGKQVQGRVISSIFSGTKSGAAEEERIVQALKDVFLFISSTAGKKLGKKMVDEQEIVMNLADILAEAFICDSAVLKLRKLESMNGDKAKLTAQRAAVQVYLYEALERVRKTSKDAITSFATGSEKSRNNWIVKKLLKSYDVNPKNLRRDIVKHMVQEGQYSL